MTLIKADTDLLAVAALPVLVEGRHVEAVLCELPEVGQVILEPRPGNIHRVLLGELVLKREEVKYEKLIYTILGIKGGIFQLLRLCLSGKVACYDLKWF